MSSATSFLIAFVAQWSVALGDVGEGLNLLQTRASVMKSLMEAPTQATTTTSAIYTFTTLDGQDNTAMGAGTGPTSASGYSGTSLDGDVTLHDGIQEWVVPATGTYKIDTYGAQGGQSSYGAGGLGAKITGEFVLSQGDRLFILVGQKGGTHGSYACGGGGSFVARGTSIRWSTPLIVAGGGASRGQTTVGPFANIDGATTQNGRNGESGNGGASFAGTGGTGGKGGTSGENSDAGRNGYCPGASGAGFDGDGELVRSGSKGVEHNAKALAFVNGGKGGVYSSICAGGFGGGGAGYDNGGGGGGYSGGGGGGSQGHLVDGGGGGGGSYNGGTSGTSGTRDRAAQQSGDGSVSIHVVGPAPTPVPTPAPTPTTTTTTTVHPPPVPPPAASTTTPPDLEGLDDDELETEVDLEKKQQDLHECRKWCYSKKHHDKAWGGKKCAWLSCSTCPECTAA